jgi:putative nucleotidyltransferase with HDIG domain
VLNAFSQVPLGMVNMRMFWEHAVTVGVFTKAIAQYCKRSQAERFYVAGLLHDIGRLMFFMKLPGVMHDLLIKREAQEQRLFTLEQEALGYTHAEAGARLLESWRIPDSIHLPIAHHHAPVDSIDYAEVAAAIHIADVWAIRHHRGSSGERFEPYLKQDALQVLSLQEYELEELWELTEDDIKNVINQFLAQ